MLGSCVENLCAEAVLPGVMEGEIGFFGTVNYDAARIEHQFLVLFFYPGDFTFACPTELWEINCRWAEFQQLQTQVWGISTDSLHTHRAWIQGEFPDGLAFPLISDRDHYLSQTFGCLNPTGSAQRCVVILNNNAVVAHYSLHENRVGRSIDDLLRILAALQVVQSSEVPVVTGATWVPGDSPIPTF